MTAYVGFLFRYSRTPILAASARNPSSDEQNASTSVNTSSVV